MNLEIYSNLMREQKNDEKDRRRITTNLRSQEDVERLLQYLQLEELSLESRHGMIPISDIDFSALKELTNLKTLTMSQYYGKLSSRTLSKLLLSIPNLRNLNLYTRPVTNDTIQGISKVKNLEHLHLYWSGSTKTDFSPLGNCINLRELNIRSTGRRQLDLGFLHTLSELTHLNLGGCYLRPIDLGPLSSCHNLQTLILSSNLLEDISLDSLSSCRHLKQLDLGGNSLTEIDLSPVSSCKELEQLDLRNNRMTEIDLSPLSSCTELKNLSLHQNRLAEIDLLPLSHCHQLKTLDLSWNRFSKIDLSPLRDMDLEDFSLRRNRLKTIDLYPLSRWYNLNRIHLGGNRLKEIDLSPLHECKVLRTLSLDKNKLQDIDLSPLAGCQYLKHLVLDYNPMVEIDLTPISTTTSVTVPLMRFWRSPRIEETQGGSVWRAQIHPKSKTEIKWPIACIRCGKTDGPFKERTFSWKTTERTDEGMPIFHVLYVGVGDIIIGKLYLTPNVFGILGGKGFASSKWEGVDTTFRRSALLDICPSCARRTSTITEFVNIEVRLDKEKNQTNFTITFSNEEYAKLFKRKNRCMKPDS